MNKERRYTQENNGIQKKHVIAIICCTVAIALCIVLFFTCFSNCGFGGNTSTNDEATLTVVTDENAYIFSEGIFIGSANAAGKSYRQMREAAEKEIAGLIKDFTIKVSAGDKEYTYKKADFTFDDNIDLLLRQAATYNDSLIGTSATGKSKRFELSFEVNEESVKAKAAEIAKETDVEPQNASIGDNGDNIGIIEAILGKKVNQPELVKDMCKEINALARGEKTKADTIKAKVEESHPELTFDDLDGKITLLSSFTSVSTNGYNGNHNMALALSACNGSVIAPGETWSFNACTGNSNLTSLGYLPATVIAGGRYEQGIGGGICQASTTIYNAAIRTNMEIVERYSHYFKSSYADAGLDATIDYPNLDLKLKNPTDYPMYFQCYMSGNTLYVNIYGWQDPSFDEVEINAYTYDEDYAGNSFRAGATRTFLKNGKVVKEEELPKSHYAYYEDKEETTASTGATETTGATTESTIPTSATNTPVLPSDPVEPTPTTPADPVEPPVTEAPAQQ